MKIDINKKYKTTNGENVVIHRVALGKVFGVIEQYYKDGLFTVWDMGGRAIESEMKRLSSDSIDLIEATENWEEVYNEVEVKGNRAIIYNEAHGEFHTIRSVQCDYEDNECLIVSNSVVRWEVGKKDIRLATKEEIVDFYFGEKGEK